MPLPKELRNRVKAFIDIAVDRLSRGLGGVLLLVLTGGMFHMKIRGLSLVVMGFCVAWAIFAWMARNEYVASVRRRLDTRRVDLHLERITVTDAHMIALLESHATGENSHQAVYALTTLSEAPGYDIRPLLKSLADNPAHEVQDKVYELAGALKFDGLLDQALMQIQEEVIRRETQSVEAAPHAAVAYALSVSSQRNTLAAELLNSRTPAIVYGTLDGLRNDVGLAKQLISPEWLAGMADSSDWRYRALAAKAIEVIGGEETEILHRLFEDTHPETAMAACRAAAAIQSRSYLSDLIRALGRSAVRGAAIDSLATYGPAICGSLSDVLLDEAVAPARLRVQIPRVLKKIPHQRSVDALFSALGQKNLTVRGAVLRALNSLRETTELHFDNAGLTEHFLSEAHHYFQLNAALQTLRKRDAALRTATDLLIRSVESDLRESLERLFQLLGLRYPPKEIRATYRALSRPGTDEAAAAIEFLDSTLEPDIKRILLPLLDAPEYTLDRGRELFGVEPTSLEDSLRSLIGSGDPWLRVCAVAAIGELKLQTLTPEIAQAAIDMDESVSDVARFAKGALSLG
jgi:AAA family ATP:ADP antiporter